MDAQPRLAGGMPNGRRSIGQMANPPTEPRSDALERAMHDVEPDQAVGRVVERLRDGGQHLEAEGAPEGDGARIALDDRR